LHDRKDHRARVGTSQKLLKFRAERPGGEAIPLGETLLEAGPLELTILAHGSAGNDGTNCHLGLDLLRGETGLIFHKRPRQ
jgi:hypothetical protein